MELDKSTKELLICFRSELEERGMNPDIYGNHDNIDKNHCKAIILHPEFNPSVREVDPKLIKLWGEE